MQRYAFEHVIGEGGFGVIHAARDLAAGRRVALKTLKTELLHDEESARRLLCEAHLMMSLRGPRAVRVTDAGVFADGQPFYAMEYLEGRDLSRVHGMDVAGAVSAIMDACVALGEAHARGLVHRDVKPANLFLTSNGVKLLDYGLGTVGTPKYMAPEQLFGSREVDARADIWSLGATLYFLLTGHAPYEAPTFFELVAARWAGHVTSVRALRPECPPELEAIVMRCIEPLPEQRFQSVHELWDALRFVAVPRALNAA